MKPALFLDRDGVVIHDSGYVKDASTVRLIDGCAALIKQANQFGIPVVLVTNQSGIGRGWIRLSDYRNVSDRMIELLEGRQARIDRIYFAPFHAGAAESPYPPEDFRFSTRGVPQLGRWDPDWRKPAVGMLREAARELGLDLGSSVLVGDRHTDGMLAEDAGLAHFIFHRSDVYAAEELQWRALRPQPKVSWIASDDLGGLELTAFLRGVRG